LRNSLFVRTQGQSYHGAASDIWSCGVILYALLAGTLPFDDKNMKDLLTKVGKGRYQMPKDIPYDAQDLIERMLIVDPYKRITVSGRHR
jgi:serine/threonine-protein kinase HSL1 (negative regulator of Swe1 kinase)